MVNIANYNDLVVGDRVIEAGNSENFHTGDWRSLIPVIDIDKCIDCFTCWIYCPDDCIIIKDDMIVGIKATHCKGCGICAKACPKKAITMTPEE